MPNSADGQQVDGLGVAEGGDRVRAQEARDHAVDVGAQLDDAAAEHDRPQVAEDGAHGRERGVEPEADLRRVAEDEGHLQAELERRSDHRAPGQGDGERVLREAAPEDHEGGDHRDVPEDGRHVGQEELVMAVQDAQAPGGEHEEPDPREQDAHDADGELADLALESGGHDPDDRGAWPGHRSATITLTDNASSVATTPATRPAVSSSFSARSRA